MNRLLQIFKIKDLRNKIFVVLGLLIAFRVLTAVPIPGIDLVRLQNFLNDSQFFGFLNIFSGGGLSNFSVAMLGVGPYITATIIMQLLTIIFPKFKQMYYEEGARGQAKFNQYSRLLTVPMALVQSYGFLSILASQNAIDRLPPFELLVNVLVIATGSMIAMWLGELITEQKIGNGISLIILAGIVADLPRTVAFAISSYTPSLLFVYIGFLIAATLITFGIVFLNEGERKVPVTYARRVRGIKMFGGVSSYLPLKVNQAGMIPLIFAVSVLVFPQFLASTIAIFSPALASRMNDLVTALFANQLLYGVFYFGLVFVFTFFYTAVTFDPKEISKNLQRSGGFIPGIRPGENTSEFFSKIVYRVTFFGAFFLGLIAVLPTILQAITKVPILTVSGTSLLIVVAVALETMRQINSQLTIREYEGLE